MRIRLILLFLPVVITCSGQYEYFNATIGVDSDEESELSVEIELLEDGYLVFGGGVNEDEFYFYRKHGFDGELIDEYEFILDEGFIFMGTGGNFSLKDSLGFLSRAHTGPQGVRGVGLKSNTELDTLWLKYYSLYDDYTSFFTHTPVEDGYAIAGEYGVGPGQRGTFIAMLDTAGQVLWHESIHAPEEGVFRNTMISTLGDAFIVSGGELINEETIGYVEFLNPDGTLAWRHEGDGPGIFRNIMIHQVLNDDQVVLAQPIAHEDYPGVNDPIWTYNLMRLYSVDLINEDISIIGDYLEEEQWVRGGPTDILAVEDGLVLMGGFFETPFENHSKSFICKLDTDYQLEWYTELNYDDCSSCDNDLFDLVQAPDGGYTMVGKFDSFEDPYDKTWLVKVDACGDLEWQGCEPVGLDSYEMEVMGDGLEVWPNPVVAGEVLSVRLPEELRVERVEVLDVVGRFEGLNVTIEPSNTQTIELKDLNLSTGLYSILVTSRDGQRYSGKFIVE